MNSNEEKSNLAVCINNIMAQLEEISNKQGLLTVHGDAYDDNEIQELNKRFTLLGFTPEVIESEYINDNNEKVKVYAIALIDKDPEYKDVDIYFNKYTELSGDCSSFFWNFNCSSIDLTDIKFKPTSCCYMFSQLRSVTNILFGDVDTSNCTNMHAMFENCLLLDDIDVSKFNTDNVTDMNSMFAGCKSLKELDLSNFNVSNVESMKQMFYFCGSLERVDLSSFRKSKVKDIDNIFFECYNLEEIDLSNFETPELCNMTTAFKSCRNAKTIRLDKLNTSGVTNMKALFYDCSQLSTLVINFNTEKVENMYEMFRGCSELRQLDLNSFNTSNVEYMDYMFYDCKSLEELHIEHLILTNIKTIQAIFKNCEKLKHLVLPNFSVANLIDSDFMFNGTKLEEIDLRGFKFLVKGKKATEVAHQILNGEYNNISEAQLNNLYNLHRIVLGNQELKVIKLDKEAEVLKNIFLCGIDVGKRAEVKIELV